MSKNSHLGAPGSDSLIEGKMAVAQFHRYGASVAAPVTVDVLTSVQGVDIGAPSFTNTKMAHRYGSGDRALELNTGIEGTGNITCLPGLADDDIATMLGVTWGTGDKAAVQKIAPTHPIGALEVIYRDVDESTVLFSSLVSEMILLPSGITTDLETGNIQIPFKYKGIEPLDIVTGAHAVLDKFSGDGSTVAFTLSDTPLDLADSSLDHNKHWVVDNAVFVKVKTTGNEAGDIQKTGFSIATTTLTFTTAPAASSEIEVLYVAADA